MPPTHDPARRRTTPPTSCPIPEHEVEEFVTRRLLVSPDLWRAAARYARGRGTLGVLAALAKSPAGWAPPGDHALALTAHQYALIARAKSRAALEARLCWNGYVILSPIGKGGMGEVHKAWDVANARYVALKRPLDAGTELVERLKREAHILGRVKHPNLAELYAHEEFGGVPLLVLEYVTGTNLRQLIDEKKNTIPWQRVAEWAVQLLSGLAALHAAGAIHRDVKPENVMLRERGRSLVAVLLDMGLGKSLWDAAGGEGGALLTVRGVPLGTFTYLPPEQWSGDAVPASDLYALGGTLFEALAGEPPFPHREMGPLCHRHTTVEPRRVRGLRPDVPPELDAVIHRLLGKDPWSDALTEVSIKMSDAIITENLGRDYGSHTVLSDLSLRIPSNTVFGFLGPNGAGKSTTIRLLTGQIKPSRGKAWVAGLDVTHDPRRTHRQIGYLSELPNFYPWMKGVELLEFVGELFGVPRAERRGRARKLLNLVGLAQDGGRKIGTYSGGMRQRLGIAQALVNRPQVIFLDEPVSALDPMGRREVLTLLENIRQEATVFMSSHVLADVDRVCEQVAILDRGRLVVAGPTGELKEKYATPAVEIGLEGGPEAAQRLAMALQGLPIIQRLTPRPDGGLKIDLRDEADLHEIGQCVPRLVSNLNLTLLSFQAAIPNLEDVFIRLVGESEAVKV